jgi:predicted esterase
MRTARLTAAAVSMSLLVLCLGPSALAQEDVADVPCEDLRVGGNGQQRYFLIGEDPARKPPENGYGLLLVLPGGDGSAEFNAFVKRIWKNTLPPGYLVAELVAVPSNDPKQIVWPTAKMPSPAKQKFTTEDFIAAVVKNVKGKQKIDEARVFALAWSSSGPAVYTSALMKDSPLRGAFVAMSVFKPIFLPPLANAKGRPFFLLQSPEDRVTPYLYAKAAKMQLAEAGAVVRLLDYEGGHGWVGEAFGSIRGGIEWLENPPEI